MNNLIIVGSRDYAIEMAETVNEINAAKPTWNLLGFLDDERKVGTEVAFGKKVLGPICGADVRDDVFYGLGISSPQGKLSVSERLLACGAKFATVVSPRAYISPTAKLGAGCFVMRMSSVNHDTLLDDFVTVGCSMIGGGAYIGKYSTTTSFVNVTNCIIGERVFIGSHSVILNKRRVGDGAYICAGSIVMGNVKSGSKVMGCPARPI